MNKIKPALFICGGLMAIATLYGAIDLATSGELTDLYVEKIDETKPVEKEETIEKKALEDTKESVKIEENKEKAITKKPAPKKKRKVAVHQSKEEKEITNEKEIAWESFSRKPINKKFRKEVVVADTVKTASLPVTKN